MIGGARLYYLIDKHNYQYSVDYSQGFFFSNDFLSFFFGHLAMLYTIILLSSPPYTCRLDSRTPSCPIQPLTEPSTSSCKAA